MQAPFDPTHAVSFDLNRGRVVIGDGDAQVVAPATALVELCVEAGSEPGRAFAAHLGSEIGRRVSKRLPDAARLSPEVVLDHLGGEWALAGLGSLGLERWGRALVLTVDGSPFGPRGDAVVAAALEGSLQRALGRQASVVVLERDDERARFAVLNRKAATQVSAWIHDGMSFGEALERLHREEGMP